MAQTQESDHRALAKWTVMIYMAADTKTDDDQPDVAFNEEAQKDLMEIKEIGSDENVHFLAQCDGIGKTTPVYRLTKENASLEADLIDNFREVNMGNIDTLLGFFNTCTRACPAEHYMFILWGHGNGWATGNFWSSEGIPPSSVWHRKVAAWRVRGFSPGGVLADKTVKEGKVDYLDSFELLKGFQEIKDRLNKNLDILGFDACLMGMIEGAYQFRDTVNHVIFSEDLQYSTDGWAYKEIAALLKAKPDTRAEDLAVFIVQQFVRKYEFQYPATLSACDMEGMKEVADAVEKLTNLLITELSPKPDASEGGESEDKALLEKRLRFDDATYRAFKLRKAIWNARREVQQYDFPPDPNVYLPDNVDLYHFCRLLRKYCDDLEIREACRVVMKTLADKAFLCSGVSGEKVNKSYGLAIYFPTDEVNQYYHRLGFALKTKWDRFLTCFLDKREWGKYLAYDVYYAQTED